MYLAGGTLGGPLSMVVGVSLRKTRLEEQVRKGKSAKRVGRTHQLDMGFVLRLDHHFIESLKDHGDDWANYARGFTGYN
jgi:hypothetical protein